MHLLGMFCVLNTRCHNIIKVKSQVAKTIHEKPVTDDCLTYGLCSHYTHRCSCCFFLFPDTKYSFFCKKHFPKKENHHTSSPS